MRALLAAFALAAVSFAALPQAAAIPEPVYCWSGIAGSECGVRVGSSCVAASGYNNAAESGYTYVRCDAGPLAGCFVHLRDGVPTAIDCGPV